MNDTLKQIGATGIVPVVVLNKVSDAEPLAESLIKGGLPCAEVTFRTDAAEESIRAIAKKFPDMFFIGVERNTTCAGITAKKLVDEPDIQNVKLISKCNLVRKKRTRYFVLTSSYYSIVSSSFG